MKNSVLVIAMLVGFAINSQEQSRVQKVNEVEVYLLAEPAREYEVLKASGGSIQWGSFVTGGLINESISTKVTKYVQKLIKDYKDQNIEFDAVVYSNGRQMNAIKFTDKKTTKNDRLANVQKIEGIPFFVMSEPVKKYDFVENIGGGIKWKSALTAGLMNNSIEEDLIKFAKKVDKDYAKKKISGVMYDRGKQASSILFTE